MATLYNQTALKKMKKPDLIKLFLDQQANLYDGLMDETDYRADLEELTGHFDDQSYENQQLKEENNELKEQVEGLQEKLDKGTEQRIAEINKINEFYMKTKEENEKLKQIIRHQKDILDEVEHSLHDENEQLKTDLEELY